jgi:trimeric autotransporter adhesin
MKHTANPLLLLPLALLAAIPLHARAEPWTYRGTLLDEGQPANGRYDLRLSLLNAAGHPVLKPVTLYQVEVRDGAFAADVDFGFALETAPPLQLKTEVQQGASGFVALGEPTRFDAKAAGMCWSTDGNTGTNASTDFIGTTDNEAFVVRTQNVRSLRIEPNTDTFANPITANIIAGSSANNVSLGVRGATISGGGVPSGDTDPVFDDEAPNRVTDSYGVVGGGYANRAGNAAGTASDEPFATVGGGKQNIASGTGTTVSGGFDNRAAGVSTSVGGGAGNRADGIGSTVGGGRDNFASGIVDTIGGGQGNVASAVFGGSTVIGGFNNTASGPNSSVSGGNENCAGGTNSWAGGEGAKVRPGTDSGEAGTGCFNVPLSGDGNGHEGTFAWADSSGGNFVSTGPNRFLVRATNGVYFGNEDTPTISIGRYLDTSTGGYLSSGGTWTNASSRLLKHAFQSVDTRAVLGKVIALPITTWQYRSSEEGMHLGPVAEDFQSAFGLGDGESIATVDADGVALAAIQGLNQKLEAQNAELQAQHDALQKEFTALRALVLEQAKPRR